MKNKERKILFIVIVISMITCIMVNSEIYNTRNHNLTVFSRSQEQLVSTMLTTFKQNHGTSRKSIEQDIISLIENSYKTSSSSYCFVMVNDKLVFMKDNITTMNLETNSSLNIINNMKQSKSAKRIDDNTVLSRLENQNEYLITIGSVKVGNKEVSLGVCTREEYIISQFQYDLFSLHMYLYFILLSISFLSVSYFLLRKLKMENRNNRKTENELINHRILVEQLYEELKVEKDKNLGNKRYGFFDKQVIESILLNLTEEQRKTSHAIRIKLDINDKVSFIHIAALLERFYTQKCVSCLWRDDEFFIVLLNYNLEDSETFIHNFNKQYQMIYNNNLTDTSFFIESIND